MPIKVTMPALSPTMEEGNLARWLKQEGDAVAPGDVIAEIETDKATMEVESVYEGTMGSIVVAEGTEGVKVNATIAWLLEDGEDASAIPDGDAAPAASASSAADKEEAKVAAQDEAPAEAVAVAPAKDKALVETPAGSKPASGASDTAAPARQQSGDRVIASPLARRMAKQAGLDLAALTGSGPKGRIVKADVEKALTDGTGKSAPAATPAADTARQVTAGPATVRPALAAEDIPHTNVR